MTSDSIVQIADRQPPDAYFELRREGDDILVLSGSTYTGPMPESLFPFGFEAPLDPWGTGKWYIPGN